MNLEFDLRTVKTMEFGVGREVARNESFCCVPVDGGVQDVLREMMETTWRALQHDLAGEPSQYQPAEKHASVEYVYLPLTDGLAIRMRELHQANNLPVDARALADPAALFCYFARATDRMNRRLTALRRATQFKGLLKSRLIRLHTNALRLVGDHLFRLDNDFDLLVDSMNVHILRPSGFEFAGKLQAAILAAVPQNIASIRQDLQFVDLAAVQDYAGKHPRAARLLASIQSQSEAQNIDKAALKKLCKANGIELRDSRGSLTVGDDQVLDFLEVLDRRRYRLELVKGTPERFKAGNRQKIGS